MTDDADSANGAQKERIPIPHSVPVSAGNRDTRINLVDDPQCLSNGSNNMSRFIIGLFLLLAAQEVNAAECGSTANRAGCVGPNGAVGVGPNGAATYNKNTRQARTAQPYHSNEVAPGVHAQGWRGNSATKAVEPGCAFVDGRQVCN
jgi:hypothetical protein